MLKMKTETISHIKSQLKPLIEVIRTGLDVFPQWTILITMRVALSNACRNDSLEEDLDNLVAFFNAIKKHDPNQHFVVYIADEVYMIVTGNEMSEDYEDEVCDICGGVKGLHTINCPNELGNSMQ